MEFNPNNKIAKLCIAGMAWEEKGNREEAVQTFSQAWSEATYDFEKFISAHFMARLQSDAASRLRWLETVLQLALKIGDDSVNSALPALYSSMARCYEDLNDSAHATVMAAKAAAVNSEPTDKGPFFHGTKADLRVDDFLTAGGLSNYKSELKMNHVYFTALIGGAGLAAALAKGDQRQRVYVVEPTGPFEHDPNVTNKKFPGNPTRSYRSEAPLKIVGEVEDWAKQTPEELHEWRERLARSKGEIIN